MLFLAARKSIRLVKSKLTCTFRLFYFEQWSLLLLLPPLIAPHPKTHRIIIVNGKFSGTHLHLVLILQVHSLTFLHKERNLLDVTHIIDNTAAIYSAGVALNKLFDRQSMRSR
jgi:hypothetical protein